MAAKVALVTGGNKGIGFELCRLLCKQFKETNGTVILTARDEPSGQSACSKLIADGYQACFIPLDVTSKISIHNAAVKIKSEYSGLDILINNAGVMYSSSKSKNIPYADQVEKTLSTNFNGVLRMCETMLPLMKRNSRIVNVTSRLGSMKLYGKEIQSKICSKNLDRDGLVDLMMQYSSKVKSNTHLEAGWPKYEPDSWIPVAYCVSKLAVTVLTRILANECQTPGVLINCCCPGWCKSGLGGESAPKSAESGAVDILNVLSHDTNGVYWEDGQMKLNDLSSNDSNDIF